MKTSPSRKRQTMVDPAKLERLRKLLDVHTDAEAIQFAVDLALAEEDIKQELASISGKGSIQRVFE